VSDVPEERCLRGQRGQLVRIGDHPHPGPARITQVHRDPAEALRQRGDRPSGRVGQPDDIKALALFLASPASEYITGQEIVIDGGWGLGIADACKEAIGKVRGATLADAIVMASAAERVMVAFGV